LTLFDGIVIAVLLVSGGLAFMRGLTNEVLSILAWVVAAFASLYLFPLLTPLLRSVIGTEWLAAVVAALIIFIIVYLLVAAGTHRWADRLMALHERAQTLDRTLGLIFGVARGLLIVTVAYLFFAWLVPDSADQPAWIRNAQMKPLVESSAEALFSLAPNDSAKIFEKEPQNSSPASPSPTQEAVPPAPDSDKSDADTGERPGYNSSERMGLDRLFENTTGE